MAEKEATAQQEGVAEVVKRTPNASRSAGFSALRVEFDLSRRMAPYFDIHLLLPVFSAKEPFFHLLQCMLLLLMARSVSP